MMITTPVGRQPESRGYRKKLRTAALHFVLDKNPRRTHRTTGSVDVDSVTRMNHGYFEAEESDTAGSNRVPSFAVYYSVLSRAVARLNTGAGRLQIYSRARKTLARQGQSSDPILSQIEFEEEQTALERAISEIEWDASSSSALRLDPTRVWTHNLIQ
jgi:hypothetical protein